MVYRGRFAPSPSGSLHFGSLVAAMGSYLDARHNAGVWLLRIEDLDPPREKPGAAAEIIKTLDAFGFEWHGEITYQSQRTEAYRNALSKLTKAGLTFPCNCTRKAIRDNCPMGMDGPIYPGTCREKSPKKRLGAIRIKVPDREIHVEDKVHGSVIYNLQRELGDFIIQRADGLFAYQLAVVVDDAQQGITHVVRGTDLLPSSPRQIYLQQLLGLPTPEYAHLPLVINRKGQKLSKQSRSRPVDGSQPLSSLIAAYQFLNQDFPGQLPTGIEEFWDWAIAHWNLKKVPTREQER
ncbi:MAG: tRNA glutamyl-Q(34) synthetase GluQRS [Gammaproteobacteria bacterium]|nr:tRNA glutamyl-Q(34) synthetase GluQRS [Gammaproteobacteria bacterium]